MPIDEDWLSRAVIPDMYPRLEDPFRPGAAVIPASAPDASFGGDDPNSPAPITAQITRPSSRPPVYQRAMNFALTAGVAPVPLINQRMDVDTIVIDVLSTAANSVFFGYGSQVSVASGIEVRPGVPLTLSVDNVREQWELQRILEFMAILMAADHNMDNLPTYRAPRVVMNANEWWLVAAANTAVTVMLFYVPELQ